MKTIVMSGASGGIGAAFNPGVVATGFAAESPSWLRHL
jgi:H+/Cl- antiporter ClcA